MAKDNHVSSERLDSNVASHKIKVQCLRSNEFDDFFIYRAKSLLELIGKAMGRPIGERDSEEVIKEFGASLSG